jgi:L-fucose mutarotase
MLKGISPLIGPELLAVLYRMGHGDEIVLADAHFPGESCGQRVVRADGLRIADLLDGILPLLALDTFGDSPTIMMAPGEGSLLDPKVEASYRRVILTHCPDAPPIVRNDRFVFYERARKAFAVVMTGETATFGNIILRKGVTPA